MQASLLLVITDADEVAGLTALSHLFDPDIIHILLLHRVMVFPLNIWLF